MIVLMAAALAVAQPAPQAVPDTLMNLALASVLAVCVGAIDGKIDFNDRAALAAYGLVPADADTEAKIRQSIPGIEMVGARVSDGSVLIGLDATPTCSVEIDGATRIAVRDELVKELLDTNVRATRTTSPENADILIFHFTSYLIYVRTSVEGKVMVQVRRP